MKKIRNYSLLGICLLLLSTAADAQSVNSFTVQQAADYAKKNSVYVKNALLDIDTEANEQGRYFNSIATGWWYCIGN